MSVSRPVKLYCQWWIKNLWYDLDVIVAELFSTNVFFLIKYDNRRINVCKNKKKLREEGVIVRTYLKKCTYMLTVVIDQFRPLILPK